MPEDDYKDAVSLRLRLPKEVVERIDILVGESGRQKFIRDAVLYRLDEDLPPIIHELIHEVEDLKARVSYLEQLKDTSVYRGTLKEVIKVRVCRDELDRKIVEHLLHNNGSTTPELAEMLLGDSSKRRTILDRLGKLNQRAKEMTGDYILRFEKGEYEGKRGAWWLIDPSSLLE